MRLSRRFWLPIVLILPSLRQFPEILKAQADLRFEVRAGKTRLTRSFAQSPLLVQRVLYLDDAIPHMASVFLLNPTPGLFQGDEHHTRINAGPLTRAHVTTPSATKVHAMPNGRALQNVELNLGKDSYLEYFPEPLIPFNNARLTQRTRANLSPKAVLVIGEVISPGRVAYGENFAFEYLDRRLTVIDPTGIPLFHESSVVSPKKLPPLRRPVLDAELPTTGTLVIIAQGFNIDELVNQLFTNLSLISREDDGFLIGLSDLFYESGLVIKVLAKNSTIAMTILRNCARTARTFFVNRMGQPEFDSINPKETG